MRCRKKYASIGYRDNKPVCLFCLQLDSDLENHKTLPPTQGIKPNHIVVHRKTKKFFHCMHIESRPSIHGIRNYYYCRTSSDGLVWLNEENIRPVNEEEADAATGYIIACRIKQALDKSDRDRYEPADIDLNRDAITDTSKLLPDLRPKAIDLFSGAGGFTLGIAPSYNVVGHVEYEKYCLATYELNAPAFGFGRSELIGKDITEITDEQILAFKQKHKHISLIVGGPPCQGFSTSGKRDPKDPRNSLFIHFIRFVSIIQPDVFIMENVPGMKSMTTATGENCLGIVLQAFRDTGYRVDWRILNAANYGVPQHRRRIFINGCKNGKPPTFPLPTHFGDDEGT